MIGNKSVLIFGVLCALLTTSVLISDVNAKSTRHINTSHGVHSSGVPHHSSSSSGHKRSADSHGYPQAHASSSYPAAKPGSLSGSSADHRTTHIVSSSARQSNSAPYPSATNSASGHGYPTAKPGSLSGGSSSNYPSANKVATNNYGSSGHGYPTSRPGSLSGGSSSINYSPANTAVSNNHGSSGHGYPTSRPGSLSGGSSSVNYYPANTAVSNNHGSSGNGYPTSRPGSLSGNNSPGQNYPSNNMNSGNKTGSPHGYPTSPSNSLSGGGSGSRYTSGGGTYYPNTNSNNYNSNRGSNHQTVHITHHNHYNYKPPTVIHYGAQSVSYPVYTGQLPTYVYEYRSSGNKYSHLLAGLALYNLGRVSGTTDSYRFHERYNPQPNEYCTFIVEQKQRNYFEEMAIDCRAISYFIYEDEPRTQVYHTLNVLNQTTITTQMMLPNGTLVSSAIQNPSNMNGYTQGMNAQLNPGIGQMPQQNLLPNGQLMPNTQQTNMVTTTTQVLSATDSRFHGRHVEVNPDMECFVTRNVRFSAGMKKQVSCELLQTYSVKSLRNSASTKRASLIIILEAFTCVSLFIVINSFAISL